MRGDEGVIASLFCGIRVFLWKSTYSGNSTCTASLCNHCLATTSDMDLVSVEDNVSREAPQTAAANCPPQYDHG